MVKILSVKKGSETIEVMNHLASHLLINDVVRCVHYENGEECGFQEASYATCDFDVHVVKKRNL